MRHISEISKEDVKDIRLIVFDVDGVFVKRGTKISTEGNLLSLEVKKINQGLIEKVRRLTELGFLVDINSGRGLYMLQEMFREILPYVSLTYENGSSSWYRGKLYQHINSFEPLSGALLRLSNIKSDLIKGFEPKEFIITIHCEDRVSEIEDVMSEFPDLYSIWNGEAYDIGVCDKQTKAVGLNNIMGLHHLEKRNVLAIGDNYNDLEMMKAAGLSVSADSSRVPGDFFVGLDEDILPAEQMIDAILKVSSDN